MKKLSLYLETSIFGFYYDDSVVNREKKDAVRKLFTQIKGGFFGGAFVSILTIAELDRTPDFLKPKLLNLIKEFEIKEFKSDNVKEEYLARQYAKKLPIFKKYDNDAMHIATAVAAGVDVLVTLNCKHIVNEQTIMAVNVINKKEGYEKWPDIRRPEEVIYYES